MGIKLAVFDIAGTTLKDNHDVSKVFQTALSHFDYQLSLDQIDPLMGYEKAFAIRQLLEAHSPKPIEDQLVKSIHQQFMELMMRYYETADLQPLPNVETTFRKLQDADIRVGINTGFSRNIASIIIDRLQWEKNKLIDLLIASDEVPEGRPHPYMIRSMMETLQISDPLEVMKTGDTEVDIREGQNAGCRYVIGITTGIFSRDALAIYNPTHIIDDIADVVTIASL
ncbi:phosphonatase-like hydrolase [Chitinophaga sp. YR573]|uniref:HAD hydrolase-like protein n=1 Tax=Chitinophaga sp. YR573 TaxID=1881040 RepID=UPI0008B31F80|nr:HAD hydrolase-like protein [Chitinophaga sp. YR573]SEW43815.1 phosphonatase-like hydrolase [Chitinophaga sp. YR573]